jgi:hypothetical protein
MHPLFSLLLQPSISKAVFVLFFVVHVLLMLSILKYSFYLYHCDFCCFVTNLWVSVTCNCLFLHHQAKASLLSSFSPIPLQPKGLAHRYEEMGRRKKTQDEKAQAAQESEFDDNMTGADDSIVLKRIKDYTIALYNEQVDI